MAFTFYLKSIKQIMTSVNMCVRYLFFFAFKITYFFCCFRTYQGKGETIRLKNPIDIYEHILFAYLMCFF